MDCRRLIDSSSQYESFSVGAVRAVIMSRRQISSAYCLFEMVLMEVILFNGVNFRSESLQLNA